MANELFERTSSTEITVRGYILDFYGQVSNAKFMELLEEARWNHFHGLFESGVFLELDLALVLVNVNINYRRPAYIGEVLDITTRIQKIGTTSITLEQTIELRKTKEAILDGTLTYVLKDLKKGTAVEITGKIEQMLIRGE